MTIACFCGAIFAKVDLLYQHATTHGHRIRCCCGSLFGTRKQLSDHQKAVEHDVRLTHTRMELLKGLPGRDGAVSNKFHTCCNTIFKDLDALEQHTIDKHPSCPICKKVFFNKSNKIGLSACEKLRMHQKATGHCYCGDHGVAFTSTTQFQVHRREVRHVTSFECMDCARTFESQRPLDDHVAGKDHTRFRIDAHDENPDNNATADALALVEETNLKCDACDQAFMNLEAFKQHKQSAKHNRLSALRCPISAECAKLFTSPSALIFHLESGECTSGMDNVKLNEITHTHDLDHTITLENNDPPTTTTPKSVTPDITACSELAVSISNLSTASSHKSGDVIDSDDSCSQSDGLDTSEAFLTPAVSTSGSRSSSSSGILLPRINTTDKWSSDAGSGMITPTKSSVHGSTTEAISLDLAVTTWRCKICSKSVRTQDHLLEHVNSPAHVPNMFRCPTSVLGLLGTRPALDFNAPSGRTQHIQSGARTGGKGALSMIVGIFKNKVKAMSRIEVKLLRGHWKA